MEFFQEGADVVVFCDVQFMRSEQTASSRNVNDIDALAVGRVGDGVGDGKHPRGDLRGVETPFWGNE